MTSEVIPERMSGLTVLLDQAAQGSEHGFSLLVNEAYDQLKRVAASRLRRRYGEQAGQMTLQPTVLAHDVLVRLRDQHTAMQNTDHFFAIAARLMFQLIADYDRARLALKRGGVAGVRALSPSDAFPDNAGGEGKDDSRDGIARVIETLHEADPRAAEIAVLHAVCGHPLESIAEALDLSLSTVKRDWRLARVWLAERLGDRA